MPANVSGSADCLLDLRCAQKTIKKIRRKIFQQDASASSSPSAEVGMKGGMDLFFPSTSQIAAFEWA